MKLTAPSVLPFLLAVGVGAACSDATERSFTQNVGLAFEECNPAEIRFVAGKHNLSPAFDWCGSNRFEQYNWSPDGRLLYFELTMAHHVMDASAEDKKTITVPTPTPSGRAGWIGSQRLAIPIIGEDGKSERITLYDVAIGTLYDHPLPGLSGVDNLFAGTERSKVVFTATKSGRRGVYQLDVDNGTVEPAMPWITGPIETFTYASEPQMAVVGDGNSVTVWHHDEKVATYAPAHRGAIHRTGAWLALEHKGDAISIFAQRTWDELSENARRRELQRTKAFEDKLPESYPREVQPPSLSFVRMATGERWAIDSFYGDQFQWYDAQKFYASFILWGFEGKQFNRNVLLGNMVDRLRSIERGEEMLGVRRFSTATQEDPSTEDPPKEEPSPTDP